MRPARRTPIPRLDSAGPGTLPPDMRLVRFRVPSAWWVPFWLLFALGRCLGETEITLSLGDIRGDGNNGLITIMGFGSGVSFSTGTLIGGGSGTGRPTFQDLSLTKLVDSATPVLLIRCATGKPVPTAILTLRDRTPGKGFAYTITLTEAFITSVSNSNGAANERPVETISLAYGRIRWTYQKLDDNGKPIGPDVSSGYDLKEARPL